MKYIFCFILFYSGLLISYSQNLIPNYSFELCSGNECPKYLRETEGGWGKVGGESFSYLDKNARESHSRNYKHICKDQPYFNSYFGNAYVRYWTRDFDSDSQPELFQVQLKDSLIKGEEYLIEYYIRCLEESKMAVTSKNDVCIFLTKHKYYYELLKPDLGKKTPYYEGKTIKESYKMTPDIFIDENKPVEDFSEWTKISNKYVAKGGEKFFLIGRYGSVEHDYEVNLDNITVQKFAGYKINIEDAEIGEAIVLENISFELNSAILTSSSFSTLNHVAELFTEYPELVVEIAGHTDNTGIKEVNMELSKNRAAAVVDYLISKGADSHKLIIKAYGDKLPISDNETEEGREENRRVEFIILQR